MKAAKPFRVTKAGLKAWLLANPRKRFACGDGTRCAMAEYIRASVPHADSVFVGDPDEIESSYVLRDGTRVRLRLPPWTRRFILRFDDMDQSPARRAAPGQFYRLGREAAEMVEP